MNFPFFKFDAFGLEVSLFVAFIIGIGFGFVLEKAGFGSAKILASQFYFTNMRVFKVMFSAIVTAMLGVFYLSWLGWLDISLVYMTDTYLVPQIAGGFILGLGFVIGGYCPGTGVVASASGAVDGMMYVVGVALGIFVFDEAFPFIKDFVNSTYMGRVSIPQYFNLSYGFVVFLVVLMALGGFIAAEWGEKLMAKKAEGKK
ncbi:MAG: YeeE/YedE thiosulfate transporter family protein [Syntrophomonadaceae bacterium]